MGMTPGDEIPGGSHSTAGERLTGLGLILLGLLGFGVVYLLWLYAPASMPAPPGIPRNLLPLASPLNCLLPITAVGSSLLVLLGLKRLILPDD
jgi:hypothetical protein